MREAFDKNVPDTVKQETAFFLSINVLFPVAASVFLMMLENWMIRGTSAQAIVLLILTANIHRIRYAEILKKSYIAICILNILSFFILGSLSFVTGIEMLWLTLQSISST